MDAAASPSLLPFVLLVIASVCWVVLIGVLLPRLLGRTLAFLANRFSRDASHFSIPSLYIYPLAGRAVAHSVRYTIPNGTVSIEELVLQCRWWRTARDVHFRRLRRWWRKARDVQSRRLPNVDDPHTLDPVATEQQAIERENASFFIKRFSYRLRRWWHRTAVTTDPNSSVESRPLISLICVGLRARIVNDQKNYAHVKKVLNLARATARRSAQFDGALPPELDIPLTNDIESSHASALSADNQSASSSSSYSSVESVDGKPWQQRALEFLSLRITDGAFYFCDMGASPLVCLTVNSAKLRYRYGAAACPADECRKCIRMRVSGLRLTVSSQEHVEKVSLPLASSAKAGYSEPDVDTVESNTDRMIRRIMLQGHKGITAPESQTGPHTRLDSNKAKHARRRTQSIVPRLMQPNISRQKLKEARIPQVLPCSEVLNTTTAVIDYVFDEPGSEPSSKSGDVRESSRDLRHVGSASDTFEKLPAPVCRISVLLRGCSFSYDIQAVADIERVIERLQPVFYDLRALARKVRSGEAKRSADGIQIEVEATPKAQKKQKHANSGGADPIISIPFKPKESNWKALLAMKLRSWLEENQKSNPTSTENRALPESYLSVLASSFTFRTEVPYQIGVQQKSILSMRDVIVNAEGVVDMPLGRSKTLSVTRIIHYPLSWKDEHIVTSDVQVSESEFSYLPDTIRVIDDFSATVQKLSRKPQSVTHFVPFRETTKIVATEGYRVILSCSHDNAWRDIHQGEADKYGRFTVCGKQGELLLSPYTATEYVQDAFALSWSLSIPNAVGKLDFSLPEDLSSTPGQQDPSNEARRTDTARSGHQKSRTSSLAHFVKSWETFASHSHHSHAPVTRHSARHFEVKVLRAGNACKLSGKATVNERKTFLGTSSHAFLDCVNRSDVHFKTSSLELDLNPHHVTHILNFVRNYAGPGLHTISAEEVSQLSQDRLSIARRILKESRFPTTSECLSLGLPAGSVLSSVPDSSALDDILDVAFQIDQVLVRLHDQPHALCPVDINTRDACSLECRKFSGSLRSNRLGLEISCSPDARKNFVYLRDGYQHFQEESAGLNSIRRDSRMNAPTATVVNFRVTKRSWSHREWGSYHSSLQIYIDNITGCVSDTCAAKIVQFGLMAVPDALHEDLLAVAEMLSVETIEAQLLKADILVLSPSSALSADRSGQMNKLLSSEKAVGGRQNSGHVHVPKFLSGVTHLRLPAGLRFVLSSLASEDVASRSRILVPDINVEVLMPWGGKLTPWVDDMTLQAQVSHAFTLRRKGVPDGFREVGLLCRAAQAKDITVDICFDSRPLLWSSRVMKLQRVHVARLTGPNLLDSLPWCVESQEEAAKERNAFIPRQALKKPWWKFLDGVCKASILEKHLKGNPRSSEQFEYLSVAILTNVVAFIAPECLENVNDIIIRWREAASFHRDTIGSQHAGSAEGGSHGFNVSDVVHLWREFEGTRKIPLPWAIDARPSTALKALETKGLTFMLTSPALVGQTRDPDTFRSSRPEKDEVTLSVPLGIHLLHMTKTDVQRVAEAGNNSSGQDFRFFRANFINVNHLLMPSIELKGNECHFFDLTGFVLISRQTTRAKGAIPIQSGDKQHDPFINQERHSLVGRVAGIGIGSKDSSLYTYACFGRVFSIFVLLFRALRLEASTLASIRTKISDELCDLLFSSTREQLGEGNPGGVRSFFVQAIHYLQSNGEQQDAISQHGALLSDQFRVPSNVLKVHSKDKSMTFNRVNSIDVSIQDFSLKAANHVVVDGDFFHCKGGFRNESKFSGPHLQGYVLNASLGALWLSMRDDTAADALRMVSEVASFVRASAFSMPTLRHDLQESEQFKAESSDVLSFSYQNENLVQGKGSELLRSSTTPPMHIRKSLWGSSLLSTNRHRGINSTRQSPFWRRRTTQRGDLPRSEGAKEIHQGTRQFWPGTGSPKPSFETNGQLGNSHPVLNDQTSISNEDFADAAVSRGNLHHPAAQSLPELASKGTLPTVKNQLQRTLEYDAQHFNSDGTLMHNIGGNGVQRYSYVAIRTAGESGPPRKRSKSMVRVGTVVPPAFSNPSGLMSSHRNGPGPDFGDQDEHDLRPRSFSSPQDEKRSSIQVSDSNQKSRVSGPSAEKSTANRSTSVQKPNRQKSAALVTLFVSCRQVVFQYFRGERYLDLARVCSDKKADIHFLVAEPRLTYMSSPKVGNLSVVATASSAELQSANDPNCILTGSIAKIGLTMSLAHGFVPSTLPKLIMSAQLSDFKTTLHAKDLRSVLTFRESFKKDLKGIGSAFLRTKDSIAEMARATKLSSSRILYAGRTVYSTVAFDLLCERSIIKLEGFHPRDSEMSVSYLLDGMFFSVVASEDDNAALTLGLRVYGHGLSLAAPSWEAREKLRFPSLDARGVQWGESTGLPTILKVTSEPLMNSTSVQGLRHVLFTVAGLLAFQNVSPTSDDPPVASPSSSIFPMAESAPHMEKDSSETQAGGTPFTRSFAAWERTKGVRMDVSIRPMSLSLVSGQVLALFDVDTIAGIFEWNKLVLAGVQLHTAISIPRISLSFMRMSTSDFTIADIRQSEKRTSMSVALERSRIDVLKTQEDLTHTFIFRIDVFAVSGQVRPWKLLLDAASWADEQEFVADLQAINYNSLSSGRQRHARPAPHSENLEPMQHRVILAGANVQRFILAVPLLTTEEYSSSRLALRATDLHFLSRQRLHDISAPGKNVMELKTHFIGILWENSPLLSTHHARISFSVSRPIFGSTALFGATSVVMYPGTWRICPRKDVVVAVLEAKNRKDNRKATEKTRELLAALPEMASYPPSSTAGDSVSYATEKQNRLLFESLTLKTFRTSGFIEGLDQTVQSDSDQHGNNTTAPHYAHHESKLSVPAFSISVVRDPSETFDIIDIDFSGREGGEFPRGCLGKVSHLIADLFGVVTADQMLEPEQQVKSVAQIQHSREMTRDVSVLIRFGKSLYRAQEIVGSTMEAKFGFFAGKSSSLLISLYTSPTLEDEGSHSTVLTGISPRLGLEITPLISGANVQSLRLTDARFLHGISPSRAPHTLMHINRVTALMEAKTLLLTQNRLGVGPSGKSTASDSDSVRRLSSPMGSSERRVLFLFGKPRLRRKSFDNSIAADGKEYRVEPDIRVQMKFPVTDESPRDEVDLFVERCIFGISTGRGDSSVNTNNLNAYTGVHNVILRAQWDLLGCKLQLREALLCYDATGTPHRKGKSVSVSKIINRLQFESTQYGRNTAKVDVDAIAAMWAVPANELLVESTSIHAEIAYTLQNAKTKLSGQVKKLKNEVRLLTEKDLSRGPRRRDRLSYESTNLDSNPSGSEGLLEMEGPPDIMSKYGEGQSITSERTVGKSVKPQQRSILMKGDELVVTMRGYQFDEARQSAEVAFVRYDFQHHFASAISDGRNLRRYLDIDFSEMRLSYVDEDRGINSDLFKIPDPKLSMSIVEGEEVTDVNLQGTLLIALKNGFYYTQDFRNLAELTIMGIEHTPPADKDEPSQSDRPVADDGVQIWNGSEARVTVNLNPKIDVMGDLTEDMLHMNMISSRLGKAEEIPRQMYDFVIIPLEAFSKALCDPLYR